MESLIGLAVFEPLPSPSLFIAAQLDIQFWYVWCVWRRLQSAFFFHESLHLCLACHERVCPSLSKLNYASIDLRECVHRVEDYWQGYKLFCYAYYLHSAQHESEFRESKLGA